MKPRTLSSHLHRAQMMKTSLGESEYRYGMQIRARTYATGAFEIHVLDPLITNPPSTSVAVVSIPAGSEPWLGSVRPCIVLSNGYIAEHGANRVTTKIVRVALAETNDSHSEQCLRHIPSA